MSAIAQLREREQATADVDAARQAVTAAQEKTAAARKRLDAFLEQHFGLQANAPEPALEPTAAAATPPSASGPDTSNPEAESLRSQLTELRAERQRLLTTLTEVHPEVVDVDGRIATVESQLQTQASANGSELPTPADSSSGEAKPDNVEQLRQNQAEAAEFRRLFSEWQTCEHALEAARADETMAIERLAALPVAAPPVAAPFATAAQGVENPPIIDDGSKMAAPVAQPAGTPPPAATNANLHTFALGALAIALAVAALAAVLLSRSGANPLFTSADDVAAALAVPVVGVVPASVANTRAGVTAEIRRFLVIVAQIVVAVAVFGAIAYAVQHAEDVLHFATNPVRSMRAWFGI